MSKTTKQSAGLLMYRHGGDALEVFLVHPGGPYFSKKNEGSWTLPKGEYEVGEEPLAAAQREFHEETGFDSNEPFMELGTVKQKNGKLVLAWAFEGDCDPTNLVSNTCEIEWPPRSKRRIVIPEVDRGIWFSAEDAKIYIREEQRPFLDRLREQFPENGK
jgi:predicted NUDIX family NTP pyrophosphohydrolase